MSLDSAVAASRPGDSIFVHSGRHLTSNVSLKWPLQIVGAPGAGAVLFAPRGADAAIKTFATARIADLAITAELGACVSHASGAVLITLVQLVVYTLISAFFHMFCCVPPSSAARL